MLQSIELFKQTDQGRFQRYVPAISRLAEALARDNRHASEDKILDVAIALERMYELDRWKITRKLSTRSSWFLGGDPEERVRVMESVEEFYDLRSEIVHGNTPRPSPERYRNAFDTGFDIAARTLFKLLKEGPPSNWKELDIAGK